MYVRTDSETTYLGHHLELGWRLKVFSSFVFESHDIKECFLFFVLEFKVTCYFSWMKQIFMLLPLWVLYEMQNQFFQHIQSHMNICDDINNPLVNTYANILPLVIDAFTDSWRRYITWNRWQSSLCLLLTTNGVGWIRTSFSSCGLFFLLFFFLFFFFEKQVENLCLLVFICFLNEVKKK